MPYIAREDGEIFVIPSYRDTLSVKKGRLLKKEILALSENYGANVTIVRKNIQQYEVAFSPDLGYLLGETIWHYFKRPIDLVYCEIIPNTTEAILVIVKSGSIFLDGTFPVDSIPEELVVFQTQQSQFDIYIYGDVPLSQLPEEGKFSFDPTQVKSFNVLDKPAFANLPTVKMFQLQPVEVAMRMQGIGVFPIKGIVLSAILVGLIWVGWNYLTKHEKELPTVVVSKIDPYQNYINALTSPAPYAEIKTLSGQITLLFSMPGWVPSSLEYGNGKLNVSVRSLGEATSTLLTWAKANKFKVEVQPDGFHLIQITSLMNRTPPNNITSLDEVVAYLVDRISPILPGNNLSVGEFINKGPYREGNLMISVNNVTVNTLDLIGQQLNNLPLVLTKVSFDFSNGNLRGTITLSALGN